MRHSSRWPPQHSDTRGDPSEPEMPDPHVPDPRVPNPRVPDPRVPDPRVPDPHAPDPLARRAVVPAHVVLRSFDAEHVALNLRTQQYHGLNPTAGRMLEVFRDAGAPALALQRLASEYDLEPAALQPHLDALIEALEARGLIDWVEP